jgi:PQQ-dependent dehydrogenase (methanol/ethanol family)
MTRRIVFSISISLLLAGLGLTAQVKEFRPVTETMLRNPAPGDWPNWRRTDNAWGYSPLDQINTRNVQQLQLAWSWAMDNTGAQETAPLVYNGVMYLPNPHGVIQALDAATGDLLWEYRPERAKTAEAGGEVNGVQRNIAIFADKIFGATSDAHLIALDARTGKLVWDMAVADSKLGYQYTSGPIVVHGKVIAGMTGCSRYKEDVCFISGHDAATGKQVWRTSTVARPGEPGGDTWGDLPLRFRAGGDAWIPGSYDPETNLLYWGTAQAKPWARAVRGTDGAALYTNSTLALDPDTGKMKWYYQHLPAETQDMDEVFENILIDSGGRKSLFKMGKLGILWQLDRTTGAFIHATDLGYQNIVEVGADSGKVTYKKVPQIGVELEMCPSTAGFKDWRAMAFSPQTNALYIPMSLNCEKATFGLVEKVLGKGGVGPVERRDYKFPQSGGNLGEFLAMDIRSGKVLWRHRTPSPSNTAALATAGGLVIGGDWDRHMYAYDATSGKILWQTRLVTSAQGFPITYLANGKQYIAMPAGTGGGSWSSLIPSELAPQLRGPKSGNALLVFALPGGPNNVSSLAIPPK